MKLIVARNSKKVIGRNGTIPWKNKEELAYFKKTTLNSIVIMGRTTWDSLPKKPLPERINVVISSKEEERDCGFFGPIYLKKPEAVFDFNWVNREEYTKNFFVIGGESIYCYYLSNNLIDEVIISEVNDESDGDRFFNLNDKWRLIDSEQKESFLVKRFKNDSFVSRERNCASCRASQD